MNAVIKAGEMNIKKKCSHYYSVRYSRIAALNEEISAYED